MYIKEEVKFIPYLSKASLSLALGKENPNTLRNYIRYWQQRKRLLPLKRGFYVSADFLEKGDNSLYYPRFLAAKMVEPSYLSREFALQEYQALTDVVYGYTAITTANTRTIKNKFGTFNYSSIKPELFCGFEKKKYGDLVWYEATKAKALFDFLYFKFRKIKKISAENVSELRINLDVFEKKDWKEFERYSALAPAKMKEVYQIIKKL